MDAVEFLKEYHRMCGESGSCCDCPLNIAGPCDISELERWDSDWVVKTVEKWSKEHPRKTRLQDFLEKYPKTPISSKGVPTRFCPQDIGYKCEYECNRGKTPPECWDEPVED